ncbi:hypothetical protein WR25_08412 [Diploscapter pachys]|uniref:Uncharacterized protein n=1 Tax=Diploscapter pachys TaxID=2018661 RepID=A0A2A2KU59_9BILA|nr:hypothetical protein WR25_08412 [Diploscapter pachys]
MLKRLPSHEPLDSFHDIMFTLQKVRYHENFNEFEIFMTSKFGPVDSEFDKEMSFDALRSRVDDDRASCTTALMLWKARDKQCIG